MIGKECQTKALSFFFFLKEQVKKKTPCFFDVSRGVKWSVDHGRCNEEQEVGQDTLLLILHVWRKASNQRSSFVKLDSRMKRLNSGKKKREVEKKKNEGKNNRRWERPDVEKYVSYQKKKKEKQ